MCLLEMVAQEYPYAECTNAAQIYKKVTGGRPPGALLRIEDPEVRQFIELCLGSFEDRPSPSELLANSFFSVEGPLDSEPVRMRPKETDVKINPPVEGSGSATVHSPGAPAEWWPSGSQGTSLGSNTTVTPRSSAVPAAVPAPAPATVPAPAPATVPAPITAPTTTVPEEPSVPLPPEDDPGNSAGGDSGQSTERHNFHVSQPGPDSDPSAPAPTDAGVQEIKLQLVIGDVVKEVTFPFNVQTDTAEEVAVEMVEDLKLECDVAWLASQLRERVNCVSNAMEDTAISGAPTTPEKRWGAVGNGIHDSPRISAITVPNSARQPLNGETQLQHLNDGVWSCLLYTSDAADDLLCVDLGGRRIIKKKK
eukprot:TRINITY_DN1613_c0_g1_i2.p1 TRINITY_DN1613_c0_g1~~TRINITY_DN1613_c0_g1_i2.p1  ORF type:complete len:365 (-),score=52.83 TRINITY_DN1613_c0_g1_i2:45-1139(-)